jgi:hypothetical protein
VKYTEIKININPSRSSLCVEAEIRDDFNPNLPAFYLHKDFEIHSLTSYGSDIKYRRDVEGNSLPYVITSEPVYICDRTDRIEISYSGFIREPVGMSNVISEERIELSLHSCYFPMHVSGGGMTEYSVEVIIPSEYLVRVNGWIESEIEHKGLTTYKYCVRNDEAGLFILALKNVRVKRREGPGCNIETLYVSEASEKAALRMLAILADIMSYYREKFCPLKEVRDVCYVISPRDSGGYAWGSIIVVPEKGEFRLVPGTYNSIGMPAHEAAHFYWNFSSFIENEDWIMEGITEYSTLSYIVENCDSRIASSMLEAGFKDIIACKSGETVMDTRPGTPCSIVNKYAKPAWIYLSAAKKYGFENIDSFFTNLYQEYSGVRNITANDYLRLFSDAVGSEAFAYIFDYLSKPGWTRDDAKYIKCILDKSVHA